MHRHPPSTSLLLVGCLAALGMIGCDRPGSAEDAEPPVATEPGMAPADPAIPGPDDGDTDAASMRYTCEGGWNVAVVGDIARVTADDGRVIELQRVADRSPPLFAGVALEFSVDGDGAVLGQDEGGPFPCQEAG